MQGPEPTPVVPDYLQTTIAFFVSSVPLWFNSFTRSVNSPPRKPFTDSCLPSIDGSQ